MTEIALNLEGISPLEFFGPNNTHLKLIRERFPRLTIASRGNVLRVQGEEDLVEEFKEVIESVVAHLNRHKEINIKDIEYLLNGADFGDVTMPVVPDEVILTGPHNNQVRARTRNQKVMVELSRGNDILFAVGPAGTGKSYTAVALAVKALKNKEVKKIVLTRPAVEAGESLGFLPGDLKDKIDPYLRPLYDALDDMIPVDKLNYYMQNRVIELAPLAYMRGRTLDHAFIILDEAQNTTELQIKMFLTRLGPNAKCIVTGDLTQIDLPKNQKSGLIKAIKILAGIQGIATVYLTQDDVIRHKLVKLIISAFEENKE